MATKTLSEFPGLKSRYWLYLYTFFLPSLFMLYLSLLFNIKAIYVCVVFHHEVENGKSGIKRVKR